MPPASTAPDARAGILLQAQIEDAAPPAVSTRRLFDFALCGDDPDVLREIVSTHWRLLETTQRLTLDIETGRPSPEFTLDAALTSALILEFPRPDASHGGLDPDRFWAHGLAVGIATRALWRELGAGSSADAFLAGLLHDLGKPVLARLAPRSYGMAVHTAKHDHDSLLDVEQALLGLDHARAGRALASRWRLPPAIADVCAWHHQPPGLLPAAVANRDLIVTVQLADAVARALRIGDGGNGAPPDELHACSRSLGIASGELSGWLDRIGALLRDHPALRGMVEAPVDDHSAAVRLERERDELAANSARWRRQAAYLHATSLVTAAGGAGESIRERCQSAAAALSHVADGAPAVVFCGTRGAPWLDLGIADTAGPRNELAPFPHDPPALAAALQLDRTTSDPSPLREAPPWLARWLERLTGPVHADEVWLYPLAVESPAFAGAALVGGRRLATALGQEREEFSALGNAIVLSLQQVRAVAEARRLGDSFADLARRVGAGQAQAVRARGLQIVSEMAAGAAHELHTPLAVISGRAQSLRDRTESEAARLALDAIVAQTRRCTEILAELTEVAFPPEPQPAAIRVAEFLTRETRNWIANARVHAAEVSLELSDDENLGLWADEQHLRLILNELLENALAATPPDGRKLAVKARRRRADETVVIELADNGHGMTADVMERAFDPFFSSRPAGRGRGLGLARAGRWAHLNHGTLSLHSTPGKGTVAEIVLPSSPPSAG